MISKRLKDSFIDVNDDCANKAASHFNFKEKNLITSAETAIIIGICHDDTYTDGIIREYYKRMKIAFNFDCVFYANSDYVFSFCGGILVNIHRVHKKYRSHFQQIWLSNKANWDAYSEIQRVKFRGERIDAFKIDSGIDEQDERERREIEEDENRRHSDHYVDGEFFFG